MNSRERVATTLRHQEPDRVPLDLGGCPQTGMHVSSVYRLRQALGLDEPGTPVKVIEPYQMLGEVAPDLGEVVGSDIVWLIGPRGMFGFPNEGWKPWTLFDGTPVLVPAGFNTDPEPDGSILMYPQGDKSVPASGKMPAGGFYFDSIIRQPPIDEDKLDPADNLEEFSVVSDADLAYYQREIERLYPTGKAIWADFGTTGFGDIAFVPGPSLKHPKGIRDVSEWYVSTVARFDYVYEVFERECEIGLTNLVKVYEVIGDRLSVVGVSGTDFGSQAAPFISPKTYRKLYKPFHRRVNDWIHTHTPWKTFIHSCGSIAPLLDDIIDAGFDYLNPVQFSAANMDSAMLKQRFGDQLVFWGGGVNTQSTLPFSTADDVRAEVRRQIETFAPGGGYVFSTNHNVQARVPMENLLALYETVNEYRG